MPFTAVDEFLCSFVIAIGNSRSAFQLTRGDAPEILVHVLELDDQVLYIFIIKGFSFQYSHNFHTPTIVVLNVLMTVLDMLELLNH